MRSLAGSLGSRGFSYCGRSALALAASGLSAAHFDFARLGEIAATQDGTSVTSRPSQIFTKRRDLRSDVFCGLARQSRCTSTSASLGEPSFKASRHAIRADSDQRNRRELVRREVKLVRLGLAFGSDLRSISARTGS